MYREVITNDIILRYYYPKCPRDRSCIKRENTPKNEKIISYDYKIIKHEN